MTHTGFAAAALRHRRLHMDDANKQVIAQNTRIQHAITIGFFSEPLITGETPAERFARLEAK